MKKLIDTILFRKPKTQDQLIHEASKIMAKLMDMHQRNTIILDIRAKRLNMKIAATIDEEKIEELSMFEP